jgi:ribonuclease HI
MSDTWTIYTDGGSRGNPGPAAFAYVIKRPGQVVIEEYGFLGETTNNIAEYTGLIRALEHAKELGGARLLINSDSELMVKQLNGQYKVKNEGLRPLYEKADALRRQFESVVIKHIYRDQNAHADALCNEAMDSRSPSRPRVSASRIDVVPTPPEAKPKILALTPLMRALEILKRSAGEWARSGDADDPPPAEVLSKICDIMKHEATDAD